MNDMSQPINDDLVTLLTATSEFAANAIVVVLEDAGIRAVAFGTVQSGFGLGHPLVFGTPVQVRREDLELARTTLNQARRDSVDIDWDKVELGEREDQLPLGQGATSLALVLGFSATALVLLIGLLAAIWWIFN
ncbi:MAG: DUF2007 domain-containing protein [Phycisphaerales bacterium]|jgi:hypothetical protein|nr:DUF2007 domain-containing protein [Phycisphaerales bacterium]